jgi:hypothetical protein
MMMITWGWSFVFLCVFYVFAEVCRSWEKCPWLFYDVNVYHEGRLDDWIWEEDSCIPVNTERNGGVLGRFICDITGNI